MIRLRLLLPLLPTITPYFTSTSIATSTDTSSSTSTYTYTYTYTNTYTYTYTNTYTNTYTYTNNNTNTKALFAGFADISALEGNDTSMDNSMSSPNGNNITLGTATKRKHNSIDNDNDGSYHNISSSLLTDKEASISISINDTSMISVDDSIIEERY